MFGTAARQSDFQEVLIASPGVIRYPKKTSTRSSIVFLYLGRRGLGRFSLEFANAVRDIEEVNALCVVSSNSDNSSSIHDYSQPVLPMPTFETAFSPQVISNFFSMRRALLRQIAEHRPVAVVNMMPHLWTPLIAPAIRRLGVPYVTIVHDAARHPGDRSGAITPWLLRETKYANLVVTLSRAVTSLLISARGLSAEKVVTLFHPDITFGSKPVSRERLPAAPLKLLFFGRILKYKGVDLLIDAVEMLRARGIRIHLGVAGSGNLAQHHDRLSGLGAEVINRWISDAEVGPLFARYDAVALSHIEASQSGVAAVAFGNGIPAVAMPTGGIAEQVVEGRTGILAHRTNAPALADAIHRLAKDTELYKRLCKQIRATAAARSMAHFADELIGAVISLK